MNEVDSKAIRDWTLSVIEDHRPEAVSDIDDSTWLDCSCGEWDSSTAKVDWHQHLVDAVEKAAKRE